MSESYLSIEFNFINFFKSIIDNNGFKQMIVLYTDRTIRVFNWSSYLTSTNSNQSSQFNNLFQETGKFVLEQTWELPDQVTILGYNSKSTLFTSLETIE